MIIRLLVRLLIRLRRMRGLELMPPTIPTVIVMLIDRRRVMRWTRILLSWRRWLYALVANPPLLATAPPCTSKVLRLQCHRPMLLPCIPASSTLPRALISTTTTLFHPVSLTSFPHASGNEARTRADI